MILLLSLLLQTTLNDPPERVLEPTVADTSLEEWAERLIDAGLTDYGSYHLLRSLLEVAPKRMAGSDGYKRATEWATDALLALELDEVWLEGVWQPRWERRGADLVRMEFATTVAPADRVHPWLQAATLGFSAGTPQGGLHAPVIQVEDLDALQALGDEVEGKIVFFPGRMDPVLRSTGAAYGAANAQRTRWPSAAAALGAAGVVIRSLSTADDDAPHTGVTGWSEGVDPIPAFALGNRSADRLEQALASGRVLGLHLQSACRTLEDRELPNVVGELRGSTDPDEVVLVGGHLDSWDTGDGAHDDGAGCVQAMEALRLLKKIGFQPERTVQVVLFAAEEIGIYGGRAFAAMHADERYLFALESDSGGFAPRGISISLDGEELTRARALAEPLAALGGDRVWKGGGGADVGPLRANGAVVGSLRVEGDRYFDLHHSRNDRLSAVHPRELQRGAIVMAWWMMMASTPDLWPVAPPPASENRAE